MKRLASFTENPPRRSTTIRRDPMFHRVFRADTTAIRAALVELKGRFKSYASDDAIGRLELALAEVLNNISEHGIDLARLQTAQDLPGIAQADDKAAPMVHLCVIRQENGLVCAVTDNGVPLPDACLNATPLSLMDDPLPYSERLVQDLPEGGFGWSLIQGLTHSICYFREDRRNVLAFTVPHAEADDEAPLPPVATVG